MLQSYQNILEAVYRRYRVNIGAPPPTVFPKVGPRSNPAFSTYGDRGLLSNETITGVVFDSDTRTPQWVGLNHPFGPTQLTGAKVVDCYFRHRGNWASRDYRVRELEFEHCAFDGTDPEHDIYCNVAGGSSTYTLAVRNSFHLNTAGQIIQTVCRPFDWYGETPPEDLGFGAPIIVNTLVAVNPGHSVTRPSNRAGFSLSFFSSQQAIGIEKVLIDKTMQPKSSGCLLVENHPTAYVADSSFGVRNAWQPIVKYKEVKEAVFDSCYFYALSGNQNLEFENCTPRFRNCKGNVYVKIDGKLYGKVSEYSG